MAADTEEAGARRRQESSTCLSEQVAVNITPSANGAGDSCVTDAKPETFEHAGEVVLVPAVPEYQGDGDRLCVLTGLEVARRPSKQLLEMVVHVQLFEDGLDQRACPSDFLRRGDRSAN